MSFVKLTFKNKPDQVVELAGDVRVEVDGVDGLESHSFHPEALVGVTYGAGVTPTPKPEAPEKMKTAAKPKTTVVSGPGNTTSNTAATSAGAKVTVTAAKPKAKAAAKKPATRAEQLVRAKAGLSREQNITKLLNLTLAGIFVDQIEELDSGMAGERVFDTLLGRLSDPRGPRKLLAVANPTSTTHWLYRRLANPGSRDADGRYVHFSMRDNQQNLPADYVPAMDETRETRPHWYRTYVLGEWGAFEGAAYTELDGAVHLVDPFPVPEWWQRFESMDHGAASPTAWLAWAADGDGNLVVHGEHYEENQLVSEHARAVLELRKRWHPPETRPVVYADPSTSASHGLVNRWGTPASVQTEYAEHGVPLTGGNKNREAGYSRLLELLHVDPYRLPPGWADVPQMVNGSPRMFVFRSCEHLWEQLQAAPVEDIGEHAGRAVQAKWEGEHGHAHAAARYGALSWMGPAVEPYQPLDDFRAELARQLIEKRDKPPVPDRSSYMG